MQNRIKRVAPGSPLRRKGVKPGWELLSVNGTPVTDVLDYRFYTYDAHLSLEFLTPEGGRKRVVVDKPEGADPGLEFETYLMDRPRSCANRCRFCFIDQNPPGMRRSLYFKDDDARLSFLMGCYITLTNLSARELDRIAALRISPINVSVHATDPLVRRTLLGNPRAGECLALMRRLAAAGIEMNCQIVCCPGLNDGAVLLRTLDDLRSLYPAVHSISVVPVGLTRHREGLPELRAFTPDLAAETLDAVARFGAQSLEELGTRLAFCADELYLLAGRPLPPDGWYEGYPQLENGVGMLRLTETEFSEALSSAGEADGAPFSIATGVAAAPLLEELLARAKEKFANLDGRVYTIHNRFYGESVTVAGLLTGGDLIAQLRGKPLGARLLIPAEMLRTEEVDFLDGVTLSEAAAALGVPVYPVASFGGALCGAMLGRLPDIPVPAAQPEETEYYPYRSAGTGEGKENYA